MSDADLRALVREAASERGAVWLRAVLDTAGVDRIAEMRGAPLRVAADVLVHFASAFVPVAFALVMADKGQRVRLVAA